MNFSVPPPSPRQSRHDRTEPAIALDSACLLPRRRRWFAGGLLIAGAAFFYRDDSEVLTSNLGDLTAKDLSLKKFDANKAACDYSCFHHLGVVSSAFLRELENNPTVACKNAEGRDVEGKLLSSRSIMLADRIDFALISLVQDPKRTTVTQQMRSKWYGNVRQWIDTEEKGKKPVVVNYQAVTTVARYFQMRAVCECQRLEYTARLDSLRQASEDVRDVALEMDRIFDTWDRYDRGKLGSTLHGGIEGLQRGIVYKIEHLGNFRTEPFREMIGDAITDAYNELLPVAEKCQSRIVDVGQQRKQVRQILEKLRGELAERAEQFARERRP